MSLLDQIPDPTSPSFALLKEEQKGNVVGHSPADWLAKWDAGGGWTVAMGLGPEYPDYEQAIHATAAEMLRVLIEINPDPDIFGKPEYEEVWNKITERVNARIEDGSLPTLSGLSGAQWSAGKNICHIFFAQNGPVKALAAMPDLARIIYVPNPAVSGFMKTSRGPSVFDVTA